MEKRILPQFAVMMLFGVLYSYYLSVMFFAAGMIFAGWFFHCFCKNRCIRCGGFFVALLCGAFFAGAWRTTEDLRLYAAVEEQAAEGCAVQLAGKVSKKEVREEKTICYLKNTQILFLDEGTVLEGKGALCYVEGAVPEIGARVLMGGTLLAMHTADNIGEFDEASYLRSQEIFIKVSATESRTVSHPRFGLRERLFYLRGQMSAQYERLLFEEEAGLLSTMALGERTQLSEDVKRMFSDAGLSHILAISGLHVSIVGMAVYRLLRKLRCSAALAGGCSAVLVCAYGMLTGFSVPTIRAVGMFLIMLGGRLFGRRYDTLSALSLLAAILMFRNPLSLFSVSFIFSFGAVLGVILVGQRLARTYLSICSMQWERTHRRDGGRHYRIRPFQRVCAAVLFAFGIQLATLPIVAYFFYAIPVYAMFLNILLLPFMTAVLSFGLLGGLGIIGARHLLYGCHLLLFYYEAAADLSLSLPFAKWIVGRPEGWRIAAYYIMLAAFLWLLEDYVNSLQKKHYVRQRTWLTGFALLSAVLLLLLGFHGRREFSLQMLSVGQGDGMYLETGTGEHYFIDGGSSSETELGKYTLQPFLYANGISHIDRWFITHMDIDHYSGCKWLLENDYQIKRFVFAAGIEKMDSFEELLALCEKKGVVVEYMNVGDAVVCESHHGKQKLRLECLSPKEPSEFSGTNENSLVLLLRQTQEDAKGAVSIVLTGDIGAEQERAILQSGGLDEAIKRRKTADVLLLKAAHHGSNNSNCEEWLSTLAPDLVLISAGKNNRYGHPGKEAVARMNELGLEHLCTIDCGQIKVMRRDGGMVVERFVE